MSMVSFPKVRRPTIRPARISAPRATTRTTEESAVVALSGLNRRGGWMLPPPRTPAPRVIKRPVLQIVEDEEVAELTPTARVSALSVWKRAPSRLLVGAIAGVLAMLAASLGLLVGSRSDAAVGTTRTTSATAPVTTGVLTVRRADVPVAPVIDVNSLPTAPPRRPQ